VRQVAHVDKRNRNGTVRYVARYVDPAGRERSKSFTRRDDAKAYLTEVEAAKLKGAWVDPAHGRTLFRDWHAEWWAGVVNLRPSTRLRDETYLRRYVLPRFGEVALDAIHQREVRAWVAWLLAQGFAPATVVKAYQLLGKVMAAAVDAGMLVQSPCRNVPLPRAEPEEMRFLNPAEVAALADRIHPAYRALVLVGAYGGLRIGELAALRRSRVDLAAGVVDVAETVNELKGRLAIGPPKTKASRRKVSLPPGVVEELAEHLRHPGRPTDFVFRARGGQVLRVSNFRQNVWRPAVAAANLDGLRIHDLRHTAVALWIAAGASPKEVAHRAGHTSVSFVLDRYGHLFPEADTTLRTRLDELFRAATEHRRNTAGPETPTAPSA
jgi:integrase